MREASRVNGWVSKVMMISLGQVRMVAWGDTTEMKGIPPDRVLTSLELGISSSGQAAVPRGPGLRRSRGRGETYLGGRAQECWPAEVGWLCVRG